VQRHPPELSQSEGSEGHRRGQGSEESIAFFFASLTVTQTAAANATANTASNTGASALESFGKYRKIRRLQERLRSRVRQCQGCGGA
jgi:hypothetical protein